MMCTLEKRGSLFVLTLTSEHDDQHRLNPTLLSSLLAALAQVKSQATDGSALVTAAHGGKFFCNGFDFRWAQDAGDQPSARLRLRRMSDSLRPVLAALLALPIPTVAAVSGHAAAAGAVLAFAHDYVLMRADRGVLYMPEVDLGITLRNYFAAIAREKFAAAARDVVLGGRKVRAREAVEMGMVHSAHDSAEGTIEAAMRLGEELARREWVGDAYAEIRKSLYPQVCDALGLTPKSVISKI